MKVKNLRKLLDLFENEEAEVFLSTETIDDQFWGEKVEKLWFGKRRYVRDNKTALRPCKETSGSTEAFVLYVEPKEER